MFGARLRRANALAHRRLKRQLDESFWSGTFQGSLPEDPEYRGFWRPGYRRKANRRWSAHRRCCEKDRHYKFKGWKKRVSMEIQRGTPPPVPTQGPDGRH